MLSVDGAAGFINVDLRRVRYVFVLAAAVERFEDAPRAIESVANVTRYVHKDALDIVRSGVCPLQASKVTYLPAICVVEVITCPERRLMRT